MNKPLLSFPDSKFLLPNFPLCSSLKKSGFNLQVQGKMRKSSFLLKFTSLINISTKFHCLTCLQLHPTSFFLTKSVRIQTQKSPKPSSLTHSPKPPLHTSHQNGEAAPPPPLPPPRRRHRGDLYLQQQPRRGPVRAGVPPRLPGGREPAGGHAVPHGPRRVLVADQPLPHLVRAVGARGAGRAPGLPRLALGPGPVPGRLRLVGPHAADVRRPDGRQRDGRVHRRRGALRRRLLPRRLAPAHRHAVGDPVGRVRVPGPAAAGPLQRRVPGADVPRRAGRRVLPRRLRLPLLHLRVRGRGHRAVRVGRQQRHAVPRQVCVPVRRRRVRRRRRRWGRRGRAGGAAAAERRRGRGRDGDRAGARAGGDVDQPAGERVVRRGHADGAHGDRGPMPWRVRRRRRRGGAGRERVPRARRQRLQRERRERAAVPRAVALEPRPRRLLRPQLQLLTGALLPSSSLQGMVSSVLQAITLNGIAEEINGGFMNGRRR
jgi:hypothetical protein